MEHLGQRLKFTTLRYVKDQFNACMCRKVVPTVIIASRVVIVVVLLDIPKS